MLLRFNPKASHVLTVVLKSVDNITLTRGSVQLLQGVNEVTNDEWKCMKDSISEKLKSGEISILAQKVTDDKGKETQAKDLSEMPINVAVKFVSECENPDTLTKWYMEETRDRVRIAIARKMEEYKMELPKDSIGDDVVENTIALKDLGE